MLRKVTHCVVCISTNFRPHELYWGDQDLFMYSCFIYWMDDNQTLPITGTKMNMRSIQQAVVYMLLRIYRRSNSFRSLAIYISDALSSEHCRCMHDEILGDIFYIFFFRRRGLKIQLSIHTCLSLYNITKLFRVLVCHIRMHNYDDKSWARLK